MTYRRRSIVIAIVIVLLLSSVVYFVLDARDRCHASIDNTTGDGIPYPVKISIVNSENEQTILYSEEVSLGKLERRFEKNIPGESHIEIRVNGTVVYSYGYIDIPEDRISVQLRILDYDADTKTASMVCKIKIGLTKTSEKISFTI